MKLFKLAFGALALSVIPFAQATILIPAGPACSVTDLITIPTALAALDCAGSFDASDSDDATAIQDTQDTLAFYFGGDASEWVLIGRSDAVGNGPFSNNPGGTSGSLFFDFEFPTPYALTLQGGDFFSAYFFGSGYQDVTGFDFEMPGRDELAHATLWKFLGDETTEIPEPATYALMGVGLSAIALWRKRAA